MEWRGGLGGAGFGRVGCVKARRLGLGKFWRGELRLGWARLDKAVELRCVQVCQGAASRGGRGEMCFGFIGFGIVC